jgi:hypothetical protein
VEAVMVVESGSSMQALAGQTACGDRGVVVPYTHGALVAVIDGLGHGQDACAAALAAENVLIAAPSDPVSELVLRCHDALRRTRGAVMSIAAFDCRNDTMTWLGVGNVEGVLVRSDGGKDETIPSRGGTVGYTLPPLNPRTMPVSPGDTLVFASDGIRHGFKGEVIPSLSAQEIAEHVMANFGKRSDDSCVVVARYMGAEA